jgi:hypothetical protein
MALVAVGSVGDPEGTRTITSIIALLVAMGLALVMIAIWLHRATRPDPELLAPLEMMGERKWRRADPVWQRRRLDELRPEGAQPLEPVAAPPDIDEAFDRGPTASGFDDLHDDRHQPEPEDASAGADGRDEYPDLEHDHSDDDTDDALRPPDPEAVPIDAPTPQDLQRPSLDDLPEGDIDPEALARAIIELDAELGRGSDVTSD